jgi:4-azaleucine resistance transporter AzlC
VTRPRSDTAAVLTLSAAVGVFGAGFGVLSTASGLSTAKACAMSLLVFTGASQFAAIGVVGAGGSPLSALASALLLAARNGAYGIVLAPVIRGERGRRLLAAHLVIDESTAMALAQHDTPARERAFYLTGIGIFVCWNVGTVLGAIGGSAIGDPAALGLDAAFPAGFVVLIAPHVRQLAGKVAAALGAAIALVLVPVTPAGVPVIAASAAALVGLRRP